RAGRRRSGATRFVVSETLLFVNERQRWPLSEDRPCASARPERFDNRRRSRYANDQSRDQREGPRSLSQHCLILPEQQRNHGLERKAIAFAFHHGILPTRRRKRRSGLGVRRTERRCRNERYTIWPRSAQLSRTQAGHPLAICLSPRAHRLLLFDTRGPLSRRECVPAPLRKGACFQSRSRPGRRRSSTAPPPCH